MSYAISVPLIMTDNMRFWPYSHPWFFWSKSKSRDLRIHVVFKKKHNLVLYCWQGYITKVVKVDSLMFNSISNPIQKSSKNKCWILGQNPPGQYPAGQNPPVDKTPQTKPPRTKPPHPHKTPYKTPQTQTTTTKPPRINPRSPTKHPDDKNLAKSKMAFILNSDGFRALLLI